MNYDWTACPRCGCQVTANFTVYPDKVSGSLRRWSNDRSVNDGRAFELPASAAAPDGSFHTPCVCGQDLEVRTQAVSDGRGGA